MGNHKLTRSEIAVLEKNGCQAENWSRIKVDAGFDPDRVRGVYFAGDVEIGNLSATVEIKAAGVKKSGLYNSYIRDCKIGNNVYIANVRNLVNYIIDDDVVIENVGDLIVTGETAFGNGTELEILNEGGGRILPIYDRLTAQIAYLIVIYRHDENLQTALSKMVADYVTKRKSVRGLISRGTHIYNSNALYNLRVGENAVISGATLLKDGTIGSCVEDPAYIGEDVIAKNFIVLSGSRVESGAILDKCFVGQGVRLGKQFSAENSAFFANCEGFHGEAVSVFAGPYTVTHHKSTLLIAGMFSFFNAGSGTNMSNHMYKLGPLHQGIMERGAKTGSFSYQLWPAHIGPFSVVNGKHYGNANVADLPFSYIVEKDGKSVLTPGMNIFTVGTRRDSAKWPARDRRKDPHKLDLINFDFLSPYVIAKVVKALEILKNLEEASKKDQEYINYQGVLIKRLMLKGSGRYYDMALKVFLGNVLTKKLGAPENITPEKINTLFGVKNRQPSANWVDLFGMLASQTDVEKLISEVKLNKVSSIESLEESLAQIHENYDENVWQYTLNLLAGRFGTEALNAEQIIQVVREWQENVERLNNLIIKDAEKEFDSGSRIGYGLDGDEAVRDADFMAVRGTLDGNKFIADLRKEIEQVAIRASQICEALKH